MLKKQKINENNNKVIAIENKLVNTENEHNNYILIGNQLHSRLKGTENDYMKLKKD